MRYVLARWLHALAQVVHAHVVIWKDINQIRHLQIIEIGKVHTTEIAMILLLYLYDANAASMRK
jgi:hypothetical protein